MAEQEANMADANEDQNMNHSPSPDLEIAVDVAPEASAPEPEVAPPSEAREDQEDSPEVQLNDGENLQHNNEQMNEPHNADDEDEMGELVSDSDEEELEVLIEEEDIEDAYPVENRMGNFGNFLNWIGEFFNIERRGSEEAAESDSDDEAGDPPDNITFDQSLPISHSYLGEMEECSGVTHQDSSRHQSLPILFMEDFIPVPGQTFALRISHFRQTALLRRVFDTPHKTFGMMSYGPRRQQRRDSDPDYDYGCTVEMRSFKENQEETFPEVLMVAVGRQRFHAIERRTQLDGTHQATVQIINDVELPELAHMNDCCHRGKVNRCFHDAPRNFTREQVGIFERRAPHMLRDYRRRWKVLQQASCVTPWPPWLYRLYDPTYLRLCVFEHVAEWHDTLLDHQTPHDPSQFSFYVISRLPLSSDLKLKLLRLRSAVQRLRYLLAILSKWTTLNCSSCSRRVGRRRDVFSMSAGGPMAAYVNPGGVVHETLTLHRAHGLVYVGRPQTQHSWFPGYAWTICECRGCHRHMGWKFTAVLPHLTPATFWGLTRSALQSRVVEDDVIADDVSSVQGDVTAPPVL